MPKRFNRDCGQRGGEIVSGGGNHNGSVAAEFALMAPLLVLIATGIADFGMLAARSAGLAATARIGAEYARTYQRNTSCDAERNELRAAIDLSGQLSAELRVQ
jgi:Flp pilus assembly protein TadG